MYVVLYAALPVTGLLLLNLNDIVFELLVNYNENTKFQKRVLEIFFLNSRNLWNFQTWKFHPICLLVTCRYSASSCVHQLAVVEFQTR